MKITQVARRFTPRAWGGTETVILETSRELVAKGHETHLVCPNALDSSRADEIDGLRVERVPYFYPYLGLRKNDRQALDFKGGNMFSFALMRRLLSQPAPDVFHVHTGKRIGGIVRTVAQRRGVPYVVTIHGGFSDVPQQERESWTAPTQGTLEWGKVLGWWVGSRRVLLDAAAVICVGESEATSLEREIPGANVVHIPNGVHPEAFGWGCGQEFRWSHAIPERSRILLHVARIDRQKNQGFSLRLLRSVLPTCPRAHLVLIGPVTDPSYEAEIRRDVVDMGLEGRVTVIPGLPHGGQELLDAYRAADVFLLPSLHEPFGITILEAWAAGLPVVASRVGGIPGFVQDGWDGLLFDPDDLAGASERLGRLLQDQRMADRLASTGRANARHRFSWQVISRQIEALYEEILEGSTSARPRGVVYGGAA